jgi:HEAT repeat protein
VIAGDPGNGVDSPVVRRRRAVLAGHRGDRREAARLTADPDPTVRAAALGALLRLGELDDDALVRGLGDSDAGVRRRACSLAGRRADAGGADPGVADPGVADPGVADDGVADDVVIDGLARATADRDSSVVETAAWALGEFGPRCGPEAIAELGRVARDHSSPVCREAAVAALGAVGHPDSLAVVLAALDDTPNIRRRAVIALVAFDDPLVDEGLRRCLEDRDWQVRQAAEELLTDD